MTTAAGNKRARRPVVPVVQLNVSITPALMDELIDYADATGQTKADAVRRLLRHALDGKPSAEVPGQLDLQAAS